MVGMTAMTDIELTDDLREFLRGPLTGKSNHPVGTVAGIMCMPDTMLDALDSWFGGFDKEKARQKLLDHGYVLLNGIWNHPDMVKE